MAASTSLLLAAVVFAFNTLFSTQGCGITTHIEIAHRAAEFFNVTYQKVDYKKLIEKHQDAFQAGNPYPDAFYDDICFKGNFHDVSEDSHWVPFMNATVNHIRQKYPQPWDEEVEKLVVFLLGFSSHQVADASWHSLDIDQGFLSTMGKVNFFGSYEDAHSCGDPGGDAVSSFEFDMSYEKMLTEWYVPVQDLVDIYQEYYGKPVVNSTLIEACTALLFLARLGERIAFAKAFAHYGSQSPFLVEEFEKYFLGGVDDMAVWTSNYWQEVTQMLEEGTSSCDLPKNPLYVNCNKASLGATATAIENQTSHSRKHLFKKLRPNNFTLADIHIRRTKRGVYFSPIPKLQDRLARQSVTRKQAKWDQGLLGSTTQQPFASLYLQNPYAHLGGALATGDLNGDGVDDLVVGAPGYSLPGQPQLGKVFVLYGSQAGGRLEDTDLDKGANLTLTGTQDNGRFGSSLALVDLNADGINDLAISAPSVGSPYLNYTGEVYVFYGHQNGLYSNPNIKLTCKYKYCNLGFSLAGGDLNGDGFADLVVGTPFASSAGAQRGFVGVLLANKTLNGVHVLTDAKFNSVYSGEQDYGWFGHGLHVSIQDGTRLLAISQPTYRHCSRADCKYSKNDTQSIGYIHVYDFSGLSPSKPSMIFVGNSEFEKLGSSMAVGDPFDSGYNIFASSGSTISVAGSVLDVPVTFKQAGFVNLTSLQSPIDSLKLYGDRNFGRFGSRVVLEDVTGDLIDDIIVSSPLRIDDLTDELVGGESGLVYVFKGGKDLSSRISSQKCSLTDVVKPCDKTLASYTLESNEDKARLGSELVVWSQNKMKLLAVSALHSNRGGRLAGVVHLYSGFT